MPDFVLTPKAGNIFYDKAILGTYEWLFWYFIGINWNDFLSWHLSIIYTFYYLDLTRNFWKCSGLPL